MKRALAGAAVIAIALVARCRCHEDPRAPWRFATFNIQDFPNSKAQAANALAEIAATGASAIAVQEITDPALFEREARRRLGSAWQFTSIDTAPVAAPDDRVSHRLGVLFDGDRWDLVSARARGETRLESGRWKPVLEVVLADRATGERVTLFDVHLKAGGDGRPIRAQQYAALADILRAPPPNTVVLGDFNATDPADRDDLARLARDRDLAWASEPLACTAFWDRDDGCFRSRLDHVLSAQRPTTIRAAGACATHGCEREDSCPRYTHDVSDHCPVVFEIAP